MKRFSKFYLSTLVVSTGFVALIGHGANILSQTLDHVPSYFPYLATLLTSITLFSIFYLLKQHFFSELTRLNQAFHQLAGIDPNDKSEITKTHFSAKIKQTAQELIKALKHSARKVEDIKNHQNRLEYALEGSGIMLWDWEINNGELTISARFADYIEVQPHSLPQNISRFIYLMPPEQREDFKQALKIHTENGESFCHHFNLITPNNTERWCTLRAQAVYNDKGKALRISGVIEDITEQKEKALEQEQKQSQLQQQLHAVNAGLITTTPDGRILKMNTLAEEITQISTEQATGQALWEVLRLHRKTTQQHPCVDLLKMVQAQGKTQAYQQSVILYDNKNQQHHIIQSAAPLLNDNNDIEGFLITFQEISHIQMAARFHLQQTHQNKLKSKKPKPVRHQKEKKSIAILTEQREKLSA